jgi:hypothetical protein
MWELRRPECYLPFVHTRIVAAVLGLGYGLEDLGLPDQPGRFGFTVKTVHPGIAVVARIQSHPDDGLCSLLWSAGYRASEATSGNEAIEIAENSGNIDLLLSDVVVPDRSGTEVALELTKSQPALTNLFISGTPWLRHP